MKPVVKILKELHPEIGSFNAAAIVRWEKFYAEPEERRMQIRAELKEQWAKDCAESKAWREQNPTLVQPLDESLQQKIKERIAAIIAHHSSSYLFGVCAKMIDGE